MWDAVATVCTAAPDVATVLAKCWVVVIASEPALNQQWATRPHPSPNANQLPEKQNNFDTVGVRLADSLQCWFNRETTFRQLILFTLMGGLYRDW